MVVVDSVTKTYSSRRGQTRALDRVSLAVRRGEAVALVGKSGSGKTTLLNCVGGLERPDAGAVTCFGVAVHALTERALGLFQRRRVGFVFQRGNLLAYLSVADNIAFPLRLNGVSGREKDRRVGELLERIGLSDAASALPHELSGGELQRVAVARAVAHGPDLVLADEPTASLDSAAGLRVLDLLLDLGRERGCTTLIATHDPDVVQRTDARVELHDGRALSPTRPEDRLSIPQA